MSERKINNMNIVAHTGAVIGRIIIAEYRKLFLLACADIYYDRHEVVRDPVRILAYLAALIRADRIEVAEQRRAEFLVRIAYRAQHILDRELCLTVGIYR